MYVLPADWPLHWRVVLALCLVSALLVVGWWLDHQVSVFAGHMETVTTLAVNVGALLGLANACITTRAQLMEIFTMLRAPLAMFVAVWKEVYGQRVDTMTSIEQRVPLPVAMSVGEQAPLL